MRQVRGNEFTTCSQTSCVLSRCASRGNAALRCLDTVSLQILLEAGTDLRYFQTLVGHKSSNTIEIYTYVSTHSLQKIRSPFDDI
jgi:integrase